MATDEASRRMALDEGMTYLSAAYRCGEWEQAQYAVYWRAIGQFDSSKIREGIETAVNNERFLPTPATLRLYVNAAQDKNAKHVVPCYATPWHVKNLRSPDPRTRAEAQRQCDHIKAMIADLRAKFAKGALGVTY